MRARKLSPQEYRRRWGIPDWRDASLYPPKLPDMLWRWEFLRRQESYRKDYEQSYRATVKWYREHSFQDFVSKRLLGPSGDAIIYPTNWDNAPDSQIYRVQMANSIPKYGLDSLMNPAIGRPDHLSFRTPGLPLLMELNQYADVTSQVRILKKALKGMQSWKSTERRLRSERTQWSMYLRALDAEASEGASYPELCKVLDPRSKRGKARGREILEAAHIVQDNLPFVYTPTAIKPRFKLVP